MRFFKRSKLLALILCLALLPFQIPKVRADDSDIFIVNVQPNIMIFIDDSGSMSDTIPDFPWTPSTTYPTMVVAGSPAGGYKSGYVYRYSTSVLDPTYTPYPSSPSYHYRDVYTQWKTSVAAVPDAGARAALTTNGYWYGYISGTYYNLYWGNYINWEFGPGTQQRMKMDIAKAVVKNLVTGVSGVRFGLSTFNYTYYDPVNGLPDGARILAEVGATASAISTAVDTLQPLGNTPLGEALSDLGEYYKGNLKRSSTGSKYSTPIQYTCQPNFIIMVTDGVENGPSKNVEDYYMGISYIYNGQTYYQMIPWGTDNTYYNYNTSQQYTVPYTNYTKINGEARNRFTQDHSTISGLQNVYVSFVGFGAAFSEGSVATATMQLASSQGGGQYYTAETEATLAAALQDAVRRAIQTTFSVATPVFPTTNVNGTSRAYIASVQSVPNTVLWRGFLKAYDRDANGNVRVYPAGDPNVGKPDESYKAWDAGDKLNATAWDSRLVYTYLNGARVRFNTTNITPANLNLTTTAARDRVVKFTLGFDTNTGQERPWKLGDVFHSTPVLVTPPPLASKDGTYLQFQQDNANRTAILLATANDGMLHAFKETNGATASEDGRELWAFIPPDVLPKLQSLTAATGDKIYTLDSSPIAADVKIGGQWRTIVVFGERRGGGYYHALDITDTTSPQYLWSFTDTNPGTLITETWSEPVIGKVRVTDGTTASDKYVAIFGGGYNSDTNNGSGKVVMAVDLATGTKIWQYYNDGTADDRRFMNFSLPANPLALSLDPDGYIDRLYLGDVGGQVWKFDLSGRVAPGSATQPATMSGGMITSWAGKRLFRPMLDTSTTDPNPPDTGEYWPEQAIYGTIAAAMDNSSPHKLWLYFGTGDRNHPNNDASNRFYGIVDGDLGSVTDMTQSSVLREAGLVNVTSTTTEAPNGWFVQLSNNEKVLSSANVFNSTVLYSAYTPTTNVVCGGIGNAKLYEVQMTTGYAAVDWSNNGSVLTTSNASIARGKSIGDGIPSKPLVTMTDTGAALATSAVTGTTSQQLTSNSVPSPTSMRNVLYWRERF
jgi:type IV pilus assembly protein PilY1